MSQSTWPDSSQLSDGKLSLASLDPGASGLLSAGNLWNGFIVALILFFIWSIVEQVCRTGLAELWAEDPGEATCVSTCSARFACVDMGCACCWQVAISAQASADAATIEALEASLLDASKAKGKSKKSKAD